VRGGEINGKRGGMGKGGGVKIREIFCIRVGGVWLGVSCLVGFRLGLEFFFVL
jgi:hypothetical protein